MDVERIERVQMRATRRIRQLKNYSYEERPRFFNLPALTFRRLTGYMIQVYNVISGIHDSSSIQFHMPNRSNTRGNKFKMQLTHIHYNI